MNRPCLVVVVVIIVDLNDASAARLDSGTNPGQMESGCRDRTVRCESDRYRSAEFGVDVVLLFVARKRAFVRLPNRKNPHYGKIPIPMWNCGNFVGFRTLAFVVNVQSIVVGFSVKVRRLDQDFGARSLDRPLIIRIVFIVDQLYHSRR